MILILRGFLDWFIKVDRFFEYIELPEDIKVKLVAYRLKGRASIWWYRLREMRMREGNGPVQTWHRMKQLLQGIFFLPDYKQCSSYAYQRRTHSSMRVNEYIAEFFRLTKRNHLPKSENQPKTLQTEGRNFLTIVYYPSSLMGEYKEIQKVHLMVVKGEI